MIPSIGRIVHYKLISNDIEIVRKKRFIFQNETGINAGNPISEGDIFPAMIVRVWDEKPSEESIVQLQVFLDGHDQLWVTSIHQGKELGQWFQPERI